MKKIKSTTIICNECGKKIEITADDAIIRFKFCGGCPGLSVTVKCSHCNKRIVLEQTSKTKKMLAKNIKKIKPLVIPMAYR